MRKQMNLHKIIVNKIEQKSCLEQKSHAELVSASIQCAFTDISAPPCHCEEDALRPTRQSIQQAFANISASLRFNSLPSKRKGVSVIVLVFSLFAIMGLASFVIDLGLILNQRYELQKAVDSAALIAISEYELYEDDRVAANDFRLRLPDDAKITHTSTGVTAIAYKTLKDYNQMLGVGTDSTPTITFNKDSRTVKVEAQATMPTYFISILGIKEITLNAKAAAVSAPAFLSGKFPKPVGSIVNGVGAYKDTDIKLPVGSDTSTGVHPTGTVYNQNNDFNNIYGQPDGRALSLGGGGHITIRLPATIYDGKGADFIVYERGHAEGYFVFAGVDIDPNNPYIDAASPGAGINWINISCTGIPLYARVDDGEMMGAHRTTVSLNGANITEYKFYGSGLFDIGARCNCPVNGTIYDGTNPVNSFQIKNIKYLKIIDDNREDGFFIQPRLDFVNHPAATTKTQHGIPMLIPGEHSSYSPGADIDAIEILHHSRLISLADYATDTDGDRLIDVVEQMRGLNPNNPDTDGDGWDDFMELEGDEPETGYGYPDSPQDETTQDDLVTLVKEYPFSPVHPPNMSIKP